jgi:molybdate transport system regulatory protein
MRGFAKPATLRQIARMSRLSIRVDLPDVGSIGPGKIRLLELVAETGSIRQAGLALEMSYARAWGLIRELNDMFGAPVVEASAGGKSGGGASLTALGLKLVTLYRAIERKADQAAREDFTALRKLARRVPVKSGSH